VYWKFGHHPHPLGYLCAKFHFCHRLHCWAGPWRKIAYWLTQSITQLVWCPWNRSRSLCFGTSHCFGRRRSKSSQSSSSHTPLDPGGRNEPCTIFFSVVSPGFGVKGHEKRHWFGGTKNRDYWRNYGRTVWPWLPKVIS